MSSIHSQPVPKYPKKWGLQDYLLSFSSEDAKNPALTQKQIDQHYCDYLPNFNRWFAMDDQQMAWSDVGEDPEHFLKSTFPNTYQQIQIRNKPDAE